jgi:hypothetical protein
MIIRPLALLLAASICANSTLAADSPLPCRELFRAERARLAPLASAAQAEMQRDDHRWRELNQRRLRTKTEGGIGGVAAGSTVGAAIARGENARSDSSLLPRAVVGVLLGATLGALTGTELGRRLSDRRQRRERGEIQTRMQRNYGLIESHDRARESTALVEAALYLRTTDRNETAADPRRVRQETERLLAYSARKAVPGQDRLALAQTLARDLLELDETGALCRDGRVPSGRALMRVVDGL